VQLPCWFQVERKKQCRYRWHHSLDPGIVLEAGRKGKWEEDEDSKLKDAIQTYGDKEWTAISALVSGRTRFQCYRRWHDTLDPSIDRANERKGKWTAVEDSKLKDAVQAHGDKDWSAIYALVPGRSRVQCRNRWKDVLEPSLGRVKRQIGKWTAVEDIKLKDAVQTHGGKNGATLAALVPDRTKN
jgi:myb proto-oncogene protein